MKVRFVVGFHSAVPPLGACRCLLWATITLSQTQSSGRIAGTVKDVQGGFIPGAEVVVENNATGDKRTATTDETGSYALPLLPPGAWVVTIATRGFATARFTNVGVSLGETTAVDATLPLAGTVNDTAPPVRSDSAEIGLALEARALSNLPLPTRNFLQLLTLAPGVTASLTNNNAVGRNSPNVSVNLPRAPSKSQKYNTVKGHSF